MRKNVFFIKLVNRIIYREKSIDYNIIVVVIIIIIIREDTNPEIAAVPVVQFQYVTFDVRRSRRLPRDRDAIVFGAALFGDDRRGARG